MTADQTGRSRAAEHGPLRVLFLCTGNSARSLIAEALLRATGGTRFEAHSAGIEPKGVNPLALRALREAGIEAGGLSSKDLSMYEGQRFDYVITVCDNAAERCPTFPGDTTRIHWSDAERAEAFRETLRGMIRRIAAFVDQAAVPRGRA
jgi:arsenate reductase